MYTKILAQGTKFGSGTTGLDNSAVHLLFRTDFSPNYSSTLDQSYLLTLWYNPKRTS